MKRAILMAVVAVMTAVGASAQNFNKGDWFVGAQSTGLTLQTRFNSDNTTTDFNLGAVGGRFLSDKFAVDGVLSFNINKVSDLESSSSYNLSVGVRYYPVWNLFARVGYNALIRNTDDTGLISDVNASMGYDMFLNDRIYFEPAVFYQRNIANNNGINPKVEAGRRVLISVL
jgi:hypothetical protein